MLFKIRDLLYLPMPRTYLYFPMGTEKGWYLLIGLQVQKDSIMNNSFEIIFHMIGLLQNPVKSNLTTSPRTRILYFSTLTEGLQEVQR